MAPFQTLSTLPKDPGNNATAEIRITPSGRFLYASNRGHDSIACFAVDTESGKLSSLGQQATEPKPRAFNLDPAGRLLGSQRLGEGRVYRIDSRSGKLEPLEVYALGQNPMWVLVLDTRDR